MLQRAALVFAITGLAASVARGQVATGVVFEDTNSDGLRQADERGIQGVAVTNGEIVVRSDDAGRYELPVDEDTIITVIKPRGYQLPLDRHGVPRHSYVHKPAGSPDDGFLFPGVAPTGPLPESVDFGLRPIDEPESFSVIAFGDPQPYSLEEIDLFRREVIDPLAVPGGVGTEGNIHGAAFGISLGDLVGDNLDLFHPLNEAQGLLGIPWHNVYGNHDMNFMAGDSSLTADDPDRWADETYERVYGSPNYAFQVGRVHFILLDNVIYQGFEGFRDETDPRWPAARKPKTGNYRGGLRDDQLRFVENYLVIVPVDDLVVLAFHIPIEGDGVHRIPEQEALFRILSTHPHTFSLSGHTHYQRHWFFGAEHGYTPPAPNQHTLHDPRRFPQPVHHHLNAVTASGSWYRGALDEYGVPHTRMRDGSPNGYTLIRFDGNRYTTEFHPARREKIHQMSVWLPEPQAGAEFVVNVFNGAPGDRVEWRLTTGTAAAGQGASPLAWTSMRERPGQDPSYVAMHAAESALPAELRTNRPSPQPVDSHHLWIADLPEQLPAGTHMIEIRHTDLYGRTTTHVHSIRITP
ncbi:MAG: calcineurin-like phosphoesterase C-terminal domain-containing protein [Phycisphaerales bacterium]